MANEAHTVWAPEYNYGPQKQRAEVAFFYSRSNAAPQRGGY